MNHQDDGVYYMWCVHIIIIIMSFFHYNIIDIIITNIIMIYLINQ